MDRRTLSGIALALGLSWAVVGSAAAYDAPAATAPEATVKAAAKCCGEGMCARDAKTKDAKPCCGETMKDCCSGETPHACCKDHCASGGGTAKAGCCARGETKDARSGCCGGPGGCCGKSAPAARSTTR
jgi:hypothetical protein